VGDCRLWIERSGLGREPTEERVHADGALQSIATPSRPVTFPLAWRLRGEGSKPSERNVAGSAEMPASGRPSMGGRTVRAVVMLGLKMILASLRRAMK
jgi:hypothetical protein